MQSLDYIEGPPLTGEKMRPGWERFSSFVQAQPDKLAVVSMHQPPSLYPLPSLPLSTSCYEASPYLRWSYRSLGIAINRLMLNLHACGVQAGMTIVTFLPNGVECVIARLAASMLGCVYAPLNPKHLINGDEVTHLLDLFLSRSGSASETASAVVIAADEHVGTLLEGEQKTFIERCLVKIFCFHPASSEEENGGDNAGPNLSSKEWRHFRDLMLDDIVTQQPIMLPSLPAISPADHLIVCTSGTTSFPKACFWSDMQVSYHYHVLEQSGLHGLSSEDTVLVCLSNNHIAGYDALSSALFFGGTAVFPGPGFDVSEFARAAVEEVATYTILVPTMVVSLSRSFAQSPLQTRLRINLGGDIATPEIVDHCYRLLGATTVFNTFGNSEGAFIKSGPLNVNQVSEAGWVPVGRPSPGQVFKLCAVDPKTDNANPQTRDTLGELHISSPGACSGYLGVARSQAFYKDEHGRQWYATGDQARIAADGDVAILGRYKDLIIRGGENISPAAVEAILSRSFAELTIQIVGVPDTDGLAGQVPVAVTKAAVTPDTIMAIRETVRKTMGPASCPEEIISLAQLGLDDYPRTASRKVKKGKLADSIRRYREKGTPNPVDSHVNAQLDTLQELTSIWATVLGLDKSLLLPESHMAQLADSITATRMLDRILKTFRKALSLAELMHADTLQQQAALLDSKAPLADNSIPLLEHDKPNQPPSIEDMIHLTEEPEQFKATQEAIVNAISHTGLGWDDVREVMPAHDMNRLSVLIGQMNRLNLKLACVIRDPAITKEQLYDSLEKVFTNNPLLASFEALIKNSLGEDLVLHVITAQTRQFLDQYIFRDGGILESVEELKHTAAERQFPDCIDAKYPGPLTKADVFFIRETGSLAILLNANHSIIDATFAQLIYEDLDAALTKPNIPLHPHIPYKHWLDSYFALRSSPAARAAVKYHVKYLEGIAQHQHAIWPRHPPAYQPRNISKASSAPDSSFLCVFDVPGFKELRKNHPYIGSHIPLKTAMAMFLMRQTGHTHALFAQTEAERTRWPFWPKSLGDRSAVNLGGQTLQTVINLASIEPEETVLSLLRRMQDTQTLQSRHAAAPRFHLMEALGDAGELVPWVANMALFNWSPAKTSASYDALNVTAVATSWDVFGFFVMGGMAGEGKLWLNLKGATLGEAEFGRIADELERLVNWLVNSENWEKVAEGFREL